MIYLDNAASTPLLPEVMVDLCRNLDTFGNPSSIHSEGVKAKQLILDAKDKVSRKLHCNRDEIFFTTGATMSNNIILQGFYGIKCVSTIEHEDIQMLADKFHYEKIPVDNDGKINITSLKRIILDLYEWDENENFLFSIQIANSEIGVIQDIQSISELIHSYPNAYLHVDATQYIPYFECDVQALKIDALSMSGQKIGCIKGTGLLYISEKLQSLISPLIYGKQGLIGGTENVLGISCLGEAFNCLDYDNKQMILLRNQLIVGLNGKLVGDIDYRLPNNVCVMFDDVDAQSLVMLLNDYGICCSAGSACSSGDSEPSSTLLAIGLTPKQANSCVRFTLSKETTKFEIDYTIDAVNKAVEFLKGLKG